MTFVPAPAFGLVEAPLPRVVDAYKDMLVAGAGGGEKIHYRLADASSDFLGLAVYNKTQGTAPTFYLRVTPSAIFTDGFDGG